MDRPTLRQLEAFEMIVREGGFRVAAQALGVSQVAVSDHIKQLEVRLGVSLFDRAPGGKGRLSAAGEAALGRAKLILADCDALVATMRDFAAVKPVAVAEPLPAPMPAVAVAPEPVKPMPPVEAPTMPRFRAMTLPTIDNPDPVVEDRPAARPLPVLPMALAPIDGDKPISIATHAAILSRFQDRLAAFEDAFPERPVSVDFHSYVTDRVALGLADGSISLAYFYALGETRVFPSDYLWSERWTLFVSPDHRLADRPYVSREEVQMERLVSWSPANRLRSLLEACLTDAGLGSMPYLFESDDHAQLVQRTHESDGILPLFGSAAARVGSSSGLARLPYGDPIPAIEVRRVVHPSLVDDVEIQTLVELLSEAMS